MANEEEKTLEELEAEYKAELIKKVQTMRDSNDAKAKADADAQAKLDEEQKEADKLDEKEKLFAEFEAKYDIRDTSEEISDPDGADATKDKPKGDWAVFHDKYLKAKGIENRTPYEQVALVTDKYGFAFDSDDNCGDDVGEWSKEDVYCDLIWQAAQCGRQLSGVITQRACDINAGDGLSVQIRTIDASTMGSTLGSCECSSCASNVFGKYTLTLARYDIYKVVCELDVFDVGDVLKSSIIESMSRAYITGIDSLIWVAIRDAAPGYTETSGTSFSCDPSRATYGNCCAYAADLYTQVIELEARMRAAGYGSNGFYLIMHPRVALYLKYKEGISPPAWVNNISMEGNKLAKIGDIKVIEYCGATACTNKDEEPIAVMIDPERAVGEAYGKRPHLLTDKDPIECDSTKLVMRTYVAISALDLNAIGHIVNP